MSDPQNPNADQAADEAIAKAEESQSRADLKAAADAILAAEGKSTEDFDGGGLESSFTQNAVHADGVMDFSADLESQLGAEADRQTATDPLLLLQQEVTLKDAEIEELKDQILRIQAEMENLRRRTQRDLADAKTYAVSKFAHDILEVGDNLGRAIGAVPEDAADTPAVKALIEGVQMTDRSMMSTMERHGVKRLEPMGEKFDPNFHQAMFEVPNTEVPHNSVFEVVQTGYSIGERVLRPAMVGVAKGGPKFAAPEAEEGSEG